MNADKRRWTWSILASVAVSIAASAFANTPVPSGKWSFVWTDAKGAGKPIRVYTYRGAKCDTTCPIVFVMHGLKRNASAYRDYWELLADRYKLIVVAPEFSQQNFPGAAGYNLGGVKEQPDREKWAFSAIEHLFDEVRDGQTGYVLFGHSAGGQFAHRFAIFRPDSRATVIVAANPGWYTMPEWRTEKEKAAPDTQPWPYSLVGAPVGPAELQKAFGKKLYLILGEKDDDPDAENLNNSEQAKKQGASRVERGENFFMASTSAAQALGTPFKWELVEAPNVAHDGNTMSKIAADTVFGQKK